MDNLAYLHAHSDYSLRDGCMRIEEYLDRLDELGYRAAALTDTHNMFGAFKFFQGARKRGLHPIVGVDLRVQRGSRRSWHAEGGSRLRVLVADRTGYQNLCGLISASYRERDGRPYVRWSDLVDRREGFIVMGPEGPGPERRPPSPSEADLRAAIREGLDTFGDQFVVEVPLRSPGDTDVVRRRVSAAREAGVAAALTHPAYFPREEDYERLPLRLAVQTNTSLEVLDSLPDHRKDQWVVGPDQWRDWLGEEADSLMRQTGEVAARCQFVFDTESVHLPASPGGEDQPGKRLEQACREALDETTFDAPSETVDERLSHELSVIREMGFADYFLIVGELVTWARQQDIRVGPGRGSAAGSLVAYLLGITRVDPFAFDLVFERFLNPARHELPDIDLDFADHRREDVIQHLRERFGREYVSHIITFGRVKTRNALRDVGRVRDEPSETIDELAGMIPAGSDRPLPDLVDAVPALRERLSEEPALRTWFRQAERLRGFVRNASVHAAGLLLLDRPIEEDLPLYYPEGSNAVSACQFDMYDLESLGYLKLDVLGLTTLTLLDRTLERIPPSKRPNLETLPRADQTTFRFLAEGSLEGIFQFESRSGRKLARRMAPTSLAELVDCIALNRPGPAQYQEDYLRRRAGEQPVNYPHEDLKPVLEDTYGLVIYQEQVMAIARIVGGFTWAEADRMRKAMGKKDSELMERLRRRFVDGAVEGGYDEAWARKMFEQLARFAQYGFNRSHSAAYGTIAYQTAYLKAHFTPAFYAAWLTLKSQDRDRIARIAEAMDHDAVSLHPPHVNQSDATFTVEDEGVRYGLVAVKHVGDDLAEAIVEARRENPFESILDFVSRVPPDRLTVRSFRALAAGGCFDGLEAQREWLIQAAEDWIGMGARRFRERRTGQGNLFADGQEDLRSNSLPPRPSSWSRDRLRRAEREALGVTVSHPAAGEPPGGA